jgi:hypothetical protein
LRNGTKIIRHYEGRRPAKNVGASARATHERRGCADGGQARAAAPSQGTLLALRKIFQARIPGTAADRGGRRRGTAAFVWQQSRPQRVPRVAFAWPRRGARIYAVAFVWPRLLDTGDCCLRLAAEPPVTSTPRGLRLAATGGASIRRVFRLAAARAGP